MSATPPVKTAARSTAAHSLRVEQRSETLGIGTGSPRFSWQIRTDDLAWRSTHYAMELTREGEKPVTAVIESPDQVLVPWPFPPLSSRDRVSVRIRVSDGAAWTDFSEPVSLEIGLLHAWDWEADFISPCTLGALESAAPIVFTDVAIQDRPVRARLFVTALGIYEFSINGQRVGGDLFAPGWTAYGSRLRYQTYDVTEQVRAGTNRLEVLLGNGWYRGQLVGADNRAIFGPRLAALAQLELLFADGRRQAIVTDESWKACQSGILLDDFYDGQTQDLRLSTLASLGSAGASAVDSVDVLDEDLTRLVAPSGPAVRMTEIRPAIRVFESPSGKTLIDFGQNLVGWVRVRVRGGQRGEEVVIRHAEVLEDGELGVRPLRSAKATCRYILAGEPEELLQPTFTFHGFRFAEVCGFPDLEVADIDALVIGSDLERIGWFECSDPDVNQLHENVVWSMRGNFLDLPTDCPQRDERLGWTGDIQVFAPTASFLFDSAGFLSSWLQDLAADQKPDGGVPYVIPNVLLSVLDPAAAGWSDAATIVPSVLHERYGDREVLERQYESMTAWVDKVTRIAGNDRLWNTGFQFGDWLDPTAPPEDAAKAQADESVVATAYFARSAQLVSEAARILGYEFDTAHFATLAESVRRAFNREYVTADGTVRSDCQTVYALALSWNLLDSEQKRLHAGTRLAELVRAAGFRVSTGFLGTPLILDSLCLTGEPRLAYEMLLQKECPSWLYAVTMKATTIWERWDSMLPDETINPASMTSFNHYAYGAVADWLHRSVAGLAPLAAGYRRVEIKPLVTGQLSSASARHRSPYGLIGVAWQLDDRFFTLRVELPAGVSGTIHLPGSREAMVVRHGNHEFCVGRSEAVPHG